MSAELKRLRRRPLLLPIAVALLIALAAASGIYWSQSNARTTVVVLVRHGEPAAGESGDPDLSRAGEQRAAGLGAYLDEVLAGRVVDHIYAADTRRSQQTAAPVANQFRLPVNLLAASDWEDLPSRIRRQHRGETVVVVGYAGTLPEVIRTLSAIDVAIEPEEYDALFIVALPSPGEARLFKLRYGPASAGKPAAQAP